MEGKEIFVVMIMDSCDYFYNIEKIFSTKEKAIQYLKDYIKEHRKEYRIETFDEMEDIFNDIDVNCEAHDYGHIDCWTVE